MNTVVGLWNRTCFLAGLVALLLSFATVAAQVVEVQNTPSPTAALSGDDSIPETNVSGMQIVSGDWRVKALYQIQEGQVRVIGLFATAQGGTTQGENIVAIYYERPSEQCGEWIAKTWDGGTVRDAVESLKGNFGIPDIQDVLWEIDVPVGGDQPAEKSYAGGFAANDPMGDIANSLDSESKQQLVECLKAGGYPVADVPFEKWDDSTTKAWLMSASSFFDATIGRNLSGQDLELAVATKYMPPTPVQPLCDAIQIFCDNMAFLVYRCLNPAYCEPERIEGEFVPDGEACECGTIGPWAYGCGRLTADARGKVTINIPYPPPLGTKLEFDVGVGASVDMCACVWVRRCMANSKRSVTLVREDCSRITFDEPGPRMQFEVYAWDFAFPSSECQNTARPLSIPGPEEPCGLSAPGH